MRSAGNGRLILSAAVPVQRYKQVLGALLLTRDNRAIAASLREVRYDMLTNSWANDAVVPRRA